MRGLGPFAAVDQHALQGLHQINDSPSRPSVSDTRTEIPTFMTRCLLRPIILSAHTWDRRVTTRELAHSVEGGLLGRNAVAEFGAVLAGDAPGRSSSEDATAFDSTGLAIQDLAIALAAVERADALDLPRLQP